jgi:hypothetical protein
MVEIILHDAQFFQVDKEEFQKAFQRSGLKIGNDNPEPMAAYIRASAIKQQLVAAIDDWALVAFMLEEVSQRNGFCASPSYIADPEPLWRDRFRDSTRWHSSAPKPISPTSSPATCCRPKSQSSMPWPTGVCTTSAYPPRPRVFMPRRWQHNHPSRTTWNWVIGFTPPVPPRLPAKAKATTS